MDVNGNFPEDLKAMDLSTFNGDITTNLTSKNSEVRQACWEGIAESLGTQDFTWPKTDTGVKGRNICHLRIVVTHINGHFFEPEDENTKVAVPDEFFSTRLSWENGPKSTA